MFGLLPAYDKHVRPHLRLPSDQDQPTGKGKEKEGVVVTPAKEGEEEGEAGEKKKKKDNYKHLIKGIPGAVTWLKSGCVYPKSIFKESIQ